MPDAPDDLISPRKAAKILGVHLATAYRWALDGKLRSWKVRHLTRVSEADVRAMLKPRGGQPKPAGASAVEALRAMGYAV